MSRAVFLFTLIALPCFAQPYTYPYDYGESDVGAKVARGDVVLADLPATFALMDALIDGTSVEVARPALDEAAFPSQAQRAAAVVTVGAAMGDAPLYARMRRHNPWVVEIDAASPIDQSMAGVQLLPIPGTDTPSPYIWLSPTNLATMAAIIAHDLQRMWPEHAGAIGENLTKILTELREFNTEHQVKFAEIENLEAIATTRKFVYLTHVLGIFVLDYVEPAADSLTAGINEYESLVILADTDASEALNETAEQRGSRVVRLDSLESFSDDSPGFQTFMARIRACYAGLLRAFSK